MFVRRGCRANKHKERVKGVHASRVLCDFLAVFRMSEQDPLLPSREAEHDIEAASDGGNDSSSWKKRVGEALESSTTHKIVITLVRDVNPDAISHD